MTGLTQSIIQDFVKGDEHAFARIYHEFYKDIKAYCFKHTRSIELAEELTSDVFLRLWENRAQLDLDRELKPWLFTITKNVAFTWLKRTATDRKMKTAFRDKYFSDQADADPDINLAAKIDLGILRKIMEQLPLKRRMAFELCKVEGLSYGEAAEVLSVSKETIKEHISLAKKDIRKLADAGDYIFVFVPFLISLKNLF